jgi:hypothetical protein
VPVYLRFYELFVVIWSPNTARLRAGEIRAVGLSRL